MVRTGLSRSAAAGFTMMELVFAFAVLSILFSVGFLGAGSKLAHVRRCYQETLALGAASGRLEQLQVGDGPLEPGTTGFPLPPGAQQALSNAAAVQTVKQLEPGLYEVQAKVSWSPTAAADPVSVTLTTLVAREWKQE